MNNYDGRFTQLFPSQSTIIQGETPVQKIWVLLWDVVKGIQRLRCSVLCLTNCLNKMQCLLLCMHVVLRVEEKD